MAEKEYIVTLKKGVDADKFNSEMTASSGTGGYDRDRALIERRPAAGPSSWRQNSGGAHQPVTCVR